MSVKFSMEVKSLFKPVKLEPFFTQHLAKYSTLRLIESGVISEEG